MRAAVFKGAGQGCALEVENVPDPTPGPRDLVVKVRRCGICGTDLHMTSGHGWDFPVGTILGHEYAGEVVATGKEVARLRVGDIVTGMAKAGCGACEACFRGLPLLCAKADGEMGGFGEYLRLPEQAAARLPGAMSLAEGALIEPLAVGLHGLAMANMPVGAKVLVLGAGSVGLAAIYWAKRMGAEKIVAASRSMGRMEMALALGADAFVQTGDGEVESVLEALGGAPEIVFECAGAVGLLSQAIGHVRPFGQVVCMGFCTAPDPVVPGIAAFKQVRICFPLAYTPEEFRQVADLMQAGKIDVSALVTSTIGLDELPDTFERLRGPNSDTKVHVQFD